MASFPEPIGTLIAALGKLPSIGPRSAERIALYLVQAEPALSKTIAEAMITARERIRWCSICGSLTEAEPCRICSDPKRDGHIICLVERAVDVLSIEKSGTYRGKFHVLGGKISPLNGIQPEDLRIAQLEARLKIEPIHEIILALGTDVEGDATSYYLAKRWAALSVKVSRIAHGLPAGTGLEFADELTLSRAIDGRREFH